MSDKEMAARVADALATITAGQVPDSLVSDRPVLADLFRALISTESAREWAEVEDLIWAVWSSHPDEGLARRMNQAIGAIARREFASARTLLDALVRDAPDWAETWNKRATLHFLEESDLESVCDIQRTLALEPRHFGAMAGLGQICLRVGDEVSALVAFQAALKVNPNLASIREALRALEGRLRRVMH